MTAFTRTLPIFDWLVPVYNPRAHCLLRALTIVFLKRMRGISLQHSFRDTNNMYSFDFLSALVLYSRESAFTHRLSIKQFPLCLKPGEIEVAVHNRMCLLRHEGAMILGMMQYRKKHARERGGKRKDKVTEDACKMNVG